MTIFGFDLHPGTSPMHPSDSTLSRLSYDVIVIGAGHAGCEAALAAAKMGCNTLLLAPNLDRIGYMPCNPSIGGAGKSQIVAEVDALGGAMAKAADSTAMQIRRLNMSKGPAVRAIRIQCDKSLYAMFMKEQLETQERLSIVQDEARNLRIDATTGRISGVVTRIMGEVEAATVVITAGTFLRATMIAGESKQAGGRAGDGGDTHLAQNLGGLAFRLRRFKTGTPPRIDARSIDISKTVPQPGDDAALWMSRDGARGEIEPWSLAPPSKGMFSTVDVIHGRVQARCFQTHTTPDAHGIIRCNLHRAPMYNGSIEGVGPRYCPSIEDKVGRFVDKESHPIFLEPEGWRSHEVYAQGLSTSLPPDIQDKVIRLVPGLEDARITRYGYAVEYDALDPSELDRSLESSRVPGLFFAGQVNGTSGYEEAAGQGIVAGANAAATALGVPGLSLTRQNSFIGVMIDDLVSREFSEPYRMLTSRAEYRLLLRSDTADARLAEIGRDLGLVSAERADEVSREVHVMSDLAVALKGAWLGTNTRHDQALQDHGLLPANRSLTAFDVARRPEASLSDVVATLEDLGMWNGPALNQISWDRAEVAIKYSSFIEKEAAEVRRLEANAGRQIAADTDFSDVTGLRVEAMQQLAKARPPSIGHAARVAGVTPTDIGALLVFLTRSGNDSPRPNRAGPLTGTRMDQRTGVQ